MRATLGRLALLAVFVFVWFGVFEGCLRLAGGSEAGLEFRELFTPDPVIGYRLRPSTTVHFATSEFATDIAINSAGVRDDEIGPKPAEERRIVVLGDSLVLAVQVPLQATFCKQLEQRLNARPGTVHYRVVNAGVQGYGPVEEALFYERVVSRLQPDLVLIVVFVANDAVEAVDAAFRLTGRGTPPVSLRQGIHDRLRRVVRRSIVLQIVNQRWMQLRERVRGARPALPDRRLLSYATPLPPDIARGLEVSRDAIDRIAANAARGGARTGIVLMPARFQIDGEEYEQLRAVVEPAGYRMSVDGARDRFALALAPTGLPMLDLLPVLRSASRSADVFFVSTGHLTPFGHQVVADTLVSFLDASHLVP